MMGTGLLLMALLRQVVWPLCLVKKGEKQIAKLERLGRLGSRVLASCTVVVEFLAWLTAWGPGVGIFFLTLRFDSVTYCWGGTSSIPGYCAHVLRVFYIDMAKLGWRYGTVRDLKSNFACTGSSFRQIYISVHGVRDISPRAHSNHSHLSTDYHSLPA